ncbi:hypothetical protein FJTKL_05418 [Diaporthe vaccinii]|uniref:Uncharacterized protein n=1 Tax=Diaporthe vaccinii TaxID=105482 RepID=A0ABR4FFT2_9PEZI
MPFYPGPLAEYANHASYKAGELHMGTRLINRCPGLPSSCSTPYSILVLDELFQLLAVDNAVHHTLSFVLEPEARRETVKQVSRSFSTKME